MLIQPKLRDSRTLLKQEGSLHIQKCRADILNNLVSDMFEDREHYQYYSEVIISVMQDYTKIAQEETQEPKPQSCFVDPDDLHLDILRKEFGFN